VWWREETRTRGYPQDEAGEIISDLGPGKIQNEINEERQRRRSLERELGGKKDVRGVKRNFWAVGQGVHDRGDCKNRRISKDNKLQVTAN